MGRSDVFMSQILAYLRIFLKRRLFLIIFSAGLISITLSYCVWLLSRATSTESTRVRIKFANTKFDHRERCSTPQINIVFLKTHKTGGSTITNILNRFAEARDLSVALPLDGFHHFLWPLPFQKNFVKKKVPQPNILSNHARFNAKPFMELMPVTTKYVTILRHPVTQFPSLFKFMDLGRFRDVNGRQISVSVEYFLDNSFEILKVLNQQNQQILIDNPRLYLLRNPQLFDLGFDQSFSENEVKIRETITAIAKKFDLILIMEYFDESLVLLRRKMCWTVDDIVYFKLNKQLEMNQHFSRVIRDKIAHWTKADMMLYDYFNQSLWSAIRNEGATFWEEVALLRKRNRQLKRVCLQRGVFLDKPYNGSTAIIYGYSLKRKIPSHFKSTCKRMVRSEMKYIKHFRIVQDVTRETESSISTHIS